jgi:Putative zinc-finger
MEHDDVVEQNIASRYLSGSLAADERAAFEEHFIDCPGCLDALESADGLQRGLKLVAAQDALHQGTRRAPRSWRSSDAIAAAVGIAAVIAIAVGVVDAVRTRRELTRMSRIATDLTGQSDRAQSVIRSLSDRVQQLENAPRGATTLATGGRPSAPVFALTTVRGDTTATPPNRVTLSAGSDWIVLSLELDDSDVAGRFRATLRDARQRERWRDDRLIASTPETLAIALSATLLDDGDYTLTIDRQLPNSATWTPTGRYAFRVVKSR